MGSVPLQPVPPMLATSADALPAGDAWSYEVKWDGYRTLALKDGARVTLYSRNLKNATAQYPTVAKGVAALATQRILLDGEVVAVDEKGRPSFQALHHQSAHTIVYYAFDLLHINGRDLLHTPLEERRVTLAEAIEGSTVLHSQNLPGTPAQIERAVRKLQLEGVVAKRLRSFYEPGRRSLSWIKVRFNRRQEFVIGGIKPGSSTTFESLLVGYYEGRAFYFAGKVRAGLTPHVRTDIMRALAKERTAHCPFANLPSSRTSHWGEGISEEDMATLHWVKPRLVIEVSFVEWTRDGRLRHPRFVAIRSDKAPKDVTRS
jgi:bifunctional non-homologous end joining protein LigD